MTWRRLRRRDARALLHEGPELTRENRQERVQAAKELADELEELDEADREELKASLDDLAKDSPAAKVAAARFKKVFAKLREQSAATLGSVVVNALSETARRALLPPTHGSR
jgi:hypothetical protein